MGGGQKRGRTQRRHFNQSRENVWKHGAKKTRSEDPNSNDNRNPNPNLNAAWEPFVSQNPGFEEYYKAQNIVPNDEWEEFLSLLRKPLPAAFRINSSGQFFQDIRSQLENDFMKSLEAEVNSENEIEAIRPLPWYPEKLAWHLNFSRMQLRKNQTLERFHEFLKQENEVGNITRQEAVSMVPPLFLDVHPDHRILDMCAAPGSKTFQLLEIIHQSTNSGLLPSGLVIANDVDVQRCNLLIHQTKRMCSANLIVTNHEAQHFPSCSLTTCNSQTFGEGQGEVNKTVLEFDRVLCDVPCSGDGTLRKAPDIWRKWNAGMGNGVHRLQVEIAMRGIALLKVGGRMVYSTCSMNPVENEAVVAEILRRSKGSVELLDVSSELPELVRRRGLKTWKVRDKGLWLASDNDVPNYRRSVILPSMFPSGQSCNNCKASSDGVEEGNVKLVDIARETDTRLTTETEIDTKNSENYETPTEVSQASDKIEKVSVKSADVESEAEVSSFPLEYCMRILPHDQNSGAFFIAVLQKLSPSQENNQKRSANRGHKVPTNMNEEPVDKHQSKTRPPEDLSHDEHPIVAEVPPEVQSLATSNEDRLASDAKDTCSIDSVAEEGQSHENGKSGHAEGRGKKEKIQTQGKWKGVDPVVFFGDTATINSIRSYYGISESFPLDGHLVTRNSDANHVKRIYYISKSVHDALQLNFQVGQRLKITSLGLKVFERQSSKDGSSSCGFRLSSEGLPLLLPYISKQIIRASLADFRHLLQYRTIKFADFVDAKFGEKALGLMPGCCVVVLNEGNQTTDAVQVDASTIAIVCWKGKTNLSIMLSQLDGQELLERLSFRFGTEKGALRDNNADVTMEIDAVQSLEDETEEGSEAAEEEIIC